MSGSSPRVHRRFARPPYGADHSGWATPCRVQKASPVPAQRFVHITGEVVRPGAVELVSQDAVSLMKVLAVSGGLTPNAKAGQTTIMHISADGVQTATAFVDLKKIIDGKARDLELTPGDVVIVPTSGVKAALRATGTSTLNSGVLTAFSVLARF